MNKKQIVDYVMNSPYNTNKAVLEPMLDSLEESSRNSLVGKWCTLGNYIFYSKSDSASVSIGEGERLAEEFISSYLVKDPTTGLLLSNGTFSYKANSTNIIAYKIKENDVITKLETGALMMKMPEIKVTTTQEISEIEYTLAMGHKYYKATYESTYDEQSKSYIYKINIDQTICINATYSPIGLFITFVS